MGNEWKEFFFENAPLDIIDGDRGKNYPKRTEFKAIGDCIFLNTGNVTKDGFNFTSLDCISNERDALLRKGKLKREDIILTTRGTVGNAAYFSDNIPYVNIRINSGMVILRPNVSFLYPRFLYSFLRSSLFKEQVDSLRTGSAQPQLPIRDINRIKIKLPSISEQKAIAHVLGSLDDRIDLNRRMNETLEAMAQALFKSWFVDFEPVIDNALASGKEVPEELAGRAAVRAALGDKRKPLPAEIRALFPDEFVYSDEMGWIPKGWDAGYFGNIIERRKKKVGDREAVVLSAVASGELVRSDEHFTKQVYSKNISKYLAVEQWDIAYNPSRINIGSIGMLKENVLGAVSPVYIVARPVEDFCWYIEFVLNRPCVREWINMLSSGSVRQSLSFEGFASIPCVIPPVNLTKRFDEIWTVFFDSITEKSNLSTTLSILRDTLLPKLLSGELRIPDAEKLAAEAVLPSSSKILFR